MGLKKKKSSAFLASVSYLCAPTLVGHFWRLFHVCVDLRLYCISSVCFIFVWTYLTGEFVSSILCSCTPTLIEHFSV